MSLTPEQRHRRDVRRKIILPVVLLALLPLLITLGLFIAAMSGSVSQQQIQVISGILLTIFILLPLAIMMLVLTGVTLLVAFGSGQLYRFVLPPIRTVRGYSEKGADLTRQGAWRISEPIIKMRSRVAGWRVSLAHLIGMEGTAHESTTEN